MLFDNILGKFEFESYSIKVKVTMAICRKKVVIADFNFTLQICVV